jgi:exopolysaccharide biosynthesis predicted pyruvyltransferase EpsI
MYTLNEAVITFGHILNDKETVTFHEFAERISGIYNLSNKHTNFIYRLLKKLSGSVTRHGDQFVFNWIDEQLQQVYHQTAKEAPVKAHRNDQVHPMIRGLVNTIGGHHG